MDAPGRLKRDQLARAAATRRRRPARPPGLGSLALGLLCLPLGSGCSGSAFELDPDLLAPAGGGIGLSPTDHLSADRLPDAGVGGAGPAPPEPEPSVCGELRSGASADDREICVPAGSFRMGSSRVSPPTGYAAHGPEHTVALSAFILDAQEVTVVRYRACVVAGVCAPPPTATEQACSYTAASGDNDRLPVTCVSWNDAQTFCGWDGGRRLPREAEWERAARGPDGATYAWGDEVSCLNAVWGGLVQCPEHGGFLPKPVGSAARGASREGALDLIGNAWEWVHDWFGPYPSTEVTDPTGPNDGATRVIRGGNWRTPPAQASAFMRRVEDPAAIGPISFRCARSPSALGGEAL